MKNILAIDIGGTNIKWGIISVKGIIKKEESIPTQAQLGGEHLMETIINLIETQLKENKTIVGIGISSAGQICPSTGKVIFATENLPGWTGMTIKDKLEQKFKIPVFVENDVNAAALGEKWMGAGRDASDFICLTIGTGIGGAIVQQNHIYHGQRGLAGEFGHIKVVKDGISCTCGSKGCLEQYASMTALIREVQKKMGENSSEYKKMNGKEIFDYALEGNNICKAGIDNFIDYLGAGIGSIVHIFNPSLIIIGGAISAQGEPLLKKIKEATKRYVMPSFAETLKIRFAICENHAGMLGVVYGWIHMREKIK